MASPDPAEDRPADDREPAPDRGHDRDPEPDDRPEGPTHIDQVPSYRRNSFCSTLLVLHVLVMIFGGCIPLASLLGIFTTIGVIAVCVIVLTGPVYFPKRKKDGTLKQWSKGNKIAAVILLILFVGGYVGLVTLLVLSGRFG